MSAVRTETVDRSTDAETPRDGFGPGYLVYSIASDFHALCCLIGKDNARQELSEIINAEFEGFRK